MKRSDRIKNPHSFRNRRAVSSGGQGWPLMHLYQMIAAALLFLVIVIGTAGIIPGAETTSQKITLWLQRSLSQESWTDQWRETWEEWIHGSEDSR